ncbi:cytosol aminopeptidase-like isoform X2 [Sitophilus oryzae]|uniref:Cytosol aminopeptidase n=1 Tax=Sitophilus oryzae TaxID=7048 RepID=A0A6J2XG16_SITOR|nr:cytosol aminopeptidase-like isoform X2 [Sitophilus oryzae]
MACILRSQSVLRLYSPIRTSVRFSNSTRKGLVLGAYSGENNKGVELTEAAKQFDQEVQGKLLEQIQLSGNEIKAGKSFTFWGLHKDYQAVSVVGVKNRCDPKDEGELRCDAKEDVRVAAAAGVKALNAAGVKDISVESFGDAESAAESSVLSSWAFQEYKTKKQELPSVGLYNADDENCKNWSRGTFKAEAQNIARRLADTPANLLTPTIFADRAQEILSPLGIDVKVYDQKWAEGQKMGAFLSVAKGSVEPPKFLEISYNKRDCNPFVLVGKGVTFDAGGISIKPAAQMDQMRADMSGAACVLATLYGLAKLNIPTNVKVLIPLVENLPSGTAVKPGDVIFAKNGKSICVDNTDAEGRLILADALCYSAELKPKWVLDIATLTGAMMVALGDAATGVFSNSNSLYQSLEASGSETGDRVWRMPLWKHYTKKISENAAYDLNNISKGRGGGSCTAAAFLREFIPEKTNWLHLDIAGVMGPDNTEPYLSKGMSGRPTRTLIDFIEKQSQ